MATGNRPLSPHLQVYKPQLTSVLSILHRITGVVLAIGTLLFTYWVLAVASGPEAYAKAQQALGSPPAMILLFLWTWALFYHFCNGIRHLFWDTGYGFDLETVNRTGWMVVIASVVLTILCWLSALS